MSDDARRSILTAMSTEIIYGPIEGAAYYAKLNRLRQNERKAWQAQKETAAHAMTAQTVEAWEADKRARAKWEDAMRAVSAHESTF